VTARTYRHELDGLRAIAVLAVLGYHAGYNDFAGGFVGVDVFLVLSGYLITQQITGQLRIGSFAPLRFWLRRARRLLPTMVPVLGFAALSALILKGDGAFGEFTRHFLSAGFFVSNYQFASEAGYFVRSSDTNLLLHTWSLSLEWQFYLVMPVFLLVLHRFGRWGMFAGLVALSAGSLFYAEQLIAAGDANWAFYAVAPRFWEFAAGGLIALAQPVLSRLPLPGQILRGVGLALILVEVFFYQGGIFPGRGALTSVIGTMLILAAPVSRYDPFRWLLTRSWMQWVGLRSYAIYLIHWPVMVTVTPSDMSRSEGILSVAIPVSIFLGHLIYRYVETPVRSGPRFRDSRAIAGYGAATLATIAVIGLAMTSAPVSALRSILPLANARTAITELDRARAEYLNLQTRISANLDAGTIYCSFDDIATTDAMLACLTDPAIPADAVLLIGDSHGRDVLAALRTAYPEQPVLMLHQSSCVPATYTKGRSLCFDALDEILQDLAGRDRLDRVILAARWWRGEHVNADATLTTLQDLSADVFLVGPGPTFASPMESLAMEAGFFRSDLRVWAGLGPDRYAFDIAATSLDLAARAATFGAGFVDRYSLFCPSDLCTITDGADGPFLYFDEQHLSPAGLDLFATMLSADPALRSYLNRP
jgi:peptidoglycan/LPS O-acetylase OafA/YrhL